MENESALVRVDLNQIIQQMEVREQAYAAKGRNTNIAFDASKALSLLTFYAGVTTGGAAAGATMPVWLVGAGCFAVASIYQKITTGRTAIIPFTNLDFGKTIKAFALASAKRNGEVPADAVGDHESERYDYQGMVSLENKVGYLLCSDWRAISVPYLQLRGTEEEVNAEFRRLVEWVKNLPRVRNFVEDLELIEQTHHGRFGIGKGAFIQWATEELDRKYAARAMGGVPVHFPQAELERANRKPQPTIIELECVEDSPQHLLTASEEAPTNETEQDCQTVFEVPSTAPTPQSDGGNRTTKPKKDKPLGSRTKVVDLAKALVTPLAKTVFVGNPGSGKGFLMAHAVIELLKKYPKAQVFFVDPKADPSECYLNGIIPDSHIFSQRLPDPLLATQEEIADWFEDLKDFIRVFEVVPSSIDNPKIIIFDETLNCKNVLEGLFTPIAKKLIDIATTGRSRGEVVWLMSQADNCKDWGMSASNLKLFRRVGLINNITGHKDYNPDLFASRADFFSEKIGAEDYSKRLIRTSDRIAFDSYSNPKWFVQGALPPLAKIEAPDGISPASQKIETRKTKTVDLEVDPWDDEPDETDPKLLRVVKDIQAKFEDRESGYSLYISQIWERTKSASSLSEEEKFDVLSMCIKDGNLKKKGKKLILL